MKHILVATDGSPTAGKAMDLALDLAKTYGAKLSIVHVLMHDHPSAEVRHMAENENLVKPHKGPDIAHANIPSGMVSVLTEAREEEIDEEVVEALGKSLLARTAARAKEAGVGDVDTVLADGDPADEIVGAAKKLGCDAIVLGSRGFGDLKGLLLGSVSHDVAKNAPCTCITVR